MLNKKAIAAFAAGATLLSGMAFAAPAFVSAPAFAETATASQVAKAKQKYEDAKKAAKAAKDAKAKADKDKTDAEAANTNAYASAKTMISEDGKTIQGNYAATYEVKDGKVQLKTPVAAGTAVPADQQAVMDACNTYLDAKAKADKAAEAANKAQDDLTKANQDETAALEAWKGLKSGNVTAKSNLSDANSELNDAKASLKAAFKAAVEARTKLNNAKADKTKAQRALEDLANTPKSKQKSKEYKHKLTDLKAAREKAVDAYNDAVKADGDAQKALTGAVSDYEAAWNAYDTAYKAAGDFADDYTDPEDLKYKDSDYDVDAAAEKGGATGTGEEGKGGEGEGGSGEHHDKNKDKITPEEAKALAEFAVKYVKDAKSDPKTVKALAAALAKVTAAKKAKDAKALVSALKELKALVDPLMKKAPAKDTGKALESIFGSDVLYTKYKGLAVDLIKLGVTNIGAYDGLLNQLEFGLSRFGWDNVVKNFPEHGPKNNCDFLAWLRRHLTKAVKHYGHVEAAVKDIQAELNEDMKDAQARHDWDAVKVIDQKIALANGLREVAHHNLTRAKALLDSANDHARDLSCDTAAKEVRAAMDKEPNSPFKKSGQKNNAQKPNGQNGQKPNGGAASHQLGKTGATVALVAVAASVLAGMGAALRKIRH